MSSKDKLIGVSMIAAGALFVLLGLMPMMKRKPQTNINNNNNEVNVYSENNNEAPAVDVYSESNVDIYSENM